MTADSTTWSDDPAHCREMALLLITMNHKMSFSRVLATLGMTMMEAHHYLEFAGCEVCTEKIQLKDDDD